jgi:hypothetical protein
MGSVSVSTRPARSLTVTANGLGPSASVQVLQGAVDYAGSHGLASNAEVIATIPASQLTSGHATLSVVNSHSSYIRTQVVDSSSGKPQSLSNPAWLFTSTPPGGIPEPRRA